MSSDLVEQVSHPLLGKPSPRLAELIDRCDAGARATLVLAAGLARRRLELQERLGASVAELQRAPWAEPAVAWREPSRAVTATDLLRAMLARHADRIAELAFASDDLDGSFGAAADACRELAAKVGDDAGGLELDAVWARSWAAVPDPRPIDRDTLLGRLTATGLRQLAAFGRSHVEGLLTEDEALNRLVDRLAAARVYCPLVPPMPAAYWDRHGGLAMLDRLLVRAPGAIIVGRAGSGRHALIEAWGRRLRAHGPGELRRFGFNIDNYHGGGEVEWKGERVHTWASVETRCICVLSSFGAQLDEADCPAELRRFPQYCLDLASDPARELRLVVVTTPEELAVREGQLPALRDFERIEVPPIADEELLPLWICHLLSIEDRLGIEISLPRLIDRLAWRSPDRLRDFTACADLACESALSGCEVPLRGFVRRARAEWLEPHQRRFTRYLENNPSVARLGVDARRWPALVALADALHGPSAHGPSPVPPA